METDLNSLRDRAYQIAKSHGFHEKEQSDETYLMLIITEIAEAVNADRKGEHASLRLFEEWEKGLNDWSARHHKDFRKCTDYPSEFEAAFRVIKDSVEDELADVAIRLLDFAGAREYDINIESFKQYYPHVRERYTFAENCFQITSYLTTDSIDVRGTVNMCLWDIISLCGIYSIDLFKFIDLKMKYNELRPYKNGKEY